MASTNHHRVDVLDASAPSFGMQLKSFSVVPTEAELGDNIWPAYFARVGDRWRGNLMGDNRAKSNIVVFESAWQFKQHIHLPGRISILAIDKQPTRRYLPRWFSEYKK